ncbi:cupin domain-containing protein [Lutibacter flavus]|uniref:Mannose-6-phosphate isomerase, cupin superfamily n=1 Tax=Lutibacter flavus TaxID=691689 RepID=A0A238XBX8_9FLAO|nr:cupin domain-containing protein [Lutibacter flavus]SNR56477.1 Mannose-6-phosphate isomerase, cupin superfamily [Lutibacter flavus]
MNLKEKLLEITEYYSPKIIGEVNDVFIKLVKIEGNKVPWHIHRNEDELFHILSGSLLLEVENQESFTINEGDLFIVKQGLKHRVSSKEECHIMLVENKTTLHTGERVNEITKSIKSQK